LSALNKKKKIWRDHLFS